MPGKQGQCRLNNTWDHLAFLLLNKLSYNSDSPLEFLHLGRDGRKSQENSILKNSQFCWEYKLVQKLYDGKFGNRF